MSTPNGEMLGREVQYGSAVQLDGLLCGVVHNALYCVMMGTKVVKSFDTCKRTKDIRQLIYALSPDGQK